MSNWKSFIFLIGILSCSLGAFAQTPGKASAAASSDTVALSPDALGAKTLLEDLIVKRYSQELSTRVAKEEFSIGAQIELSMRPEDEVPAQEPLSDLSLGQLDPEALMKKFSGTPNDFASSLLSQYLIKSVTVAVGLRSEIGEEKKAEVNAWLGKRLKSEFGAKGVGEVHFIKVSPPPPKEKEPEAPPSTFKDLLKDFQELAGQALMALALLMGALVWGLLASKKPSENAGASVNISNETGGETSRDGGGFPGETTLHLDNKSREELSARQEVQELTQQILQLMPQLGSQLSSVLQTWCQQGEAGKFKTVCFSEAIGKEIGKLPLPVDALPDLRKIFSQMPAVQWTEKKSALQKAYWEILSVINLGAESLNVPFSYIGGLNVDSVNQVLHEQNPKMRTLVSLFMPDDLRLNYMNSLNEDRKLELLKSAAELSEIPASELQQADRTLAAKMNSLSSNAEVIRLDMTLNKVVEGLSQIEQIKLLREVSGPAIHTFRRTTPSLAFLGDWTDESLGLLISRLSVDEITAYLRLRPDLTDKFLATAPTMTSQMTKDELSREDSFSDTEKNRLLEGLLGKIKNMVDSKELDLSKVFASESSDFSQKPGSAAA